MEDHAHGIGCAFCEEYRETGRHLWLIAHPYLKHNHVLMNLQALFEQSGLRNTVKLHSCDLMGFAAIFVGLAIGQGFAGIIWNLILGQTELSSTQSIQLVAG